MTTEREYAVRLVSMVSYVVVVDITFPAGLPFWAAQDWWSAYTLDCYLKGIPFGGAMFTNADHPVAQARTNELVSSLHTAENCITAGDPIAVWPEGLPRDVAHVPEEVCAGMRR